MHDFDLERLVLCCFLFYPDHFADPENSFPLEAFYSEQHRIVFSHMKAIQESTKELEYVALIMVLREAGHHRLIMNVCIPMLGIMRSYEPECAYVKTHINTMLKLMIKRERDKALAKFKQDIHDGRDAIEAQMELDSVLMILNTYIHDQDEEELDELLDQLEVSHLETGYYDLDKQIGGLANPGLNIIAARPSVGKSSFARGIITHVSKFKKVYWYSQDQSRAQIYGLEATKRGYDISKMTREQRAGFIHTVKNEYWHNNVILTDNPVPISQLITNIKLANPDVVVIDYLQIVRSSEKDEYDRVTTVCMELKTLSLQMKLPVIALAQFNRQFKKGDVPDMSWLRGSGQIEQDGDIILALDRDSDNLSEYTDAYLYVLKNKVGPRARVQLVWQSSAASYRNASKPGQVTYAN